MSREEQSATENIENTGQRQSSVIDDIANAYVQDLARLKPLFATEVGIKGFDDLWDDLSPAGHAAVAELDRATLLKLDHAAATADPQSLDATDRITVDAMQERLGVELELHEAHQDIAELNNIASPVQYLRDIFDIAPTGSIEDWENIATRLNTLPQVVDGVIASWREAARHGQVAAIRQVEECITQSAQQANPEQSFFTSFIRSKDLDLVLDESASCAALRKELEYGARAAREAYGNMHAFLKEELAPQANEVDAVGRDRYALHSRYFLGAEVDLDETYDWGVVELEAIIAEQTTLAAQIAGPGATIEQAIAELDKDPARNLTGTKALRDWMQERSDAAVADLNGTHFDISEPVLELECMIVPTQTGGIYYTPPSDDFSRPGRMWWSVPQGVTEFSTWRELTTVYHEGVPGHHLQIGQVTYDHANLNDWRRLACWVSGHGEGWALYAERLMADLGYLDDPGDRLGMLDSQRLRAARVVFDIGLHLGKPMPTRWGSGTWDADQGWEFLKSNVSMDSELLRFEWNRYLGWPGQAPSYKIGQRLWEKARDDAAQLAGQGGEDFSLRDFHAKALSIGSVGLDVLRRALNS